MISAWLHRKGIARMLNSRSDNMSNRGGAYIQARGPEWAARLLAIYALRHAAHVRFDWDTARIYETQRVARFTRRFQVSYRRL